MLDAAQKFTIFSAQLGQVFLVVGQGIKAGKIIAEGTDKDKNQHAGQGQDAGGEAVFLNLAVVRGDKDEGKPFSMHAG
jgi:hypothetical protein